ncbi:MAG: ribonuclease H family protein [Clostridium sp.]|nr:ribonuclease H family protein [Clostridium sp.]MCM1171049.1 ribonuclease H family protein [Clostridium sp.]MCM1208916.1 ribonuclease H family protein [Ruminococcus sp.]
MAKKFYAVKIGKTPGVYETWEACKNQIHGFSGAVYKGFATKEEAMAFVGEGEREPKKSEETQAVAYVDGSYDSAKNAFSYGMVFFYHGQELHFSQKFDDTELAKMHNVAGEIKGAEAAIQYCLDNHIASVTIYHDYEGIAKWCNGDWKANKAGTIAYANFYREAASKVAIQFVKVKGHSGDRYNDLADRLAKEALGIGN